jgi:hypothetical protein
MQIGVYRRICSNGLVASEDSFAAIRFRHSGLKTEQVVEASFRILEYIPQIGTLITRFKQLMLSGSEAQTFAQQALLLRYESLDESPINPDTLLTVRRTEDQPNDLWTTFNRVQENLIRGGLSDNKRSRAGRLRSLRTLSGIDSKVFINKRLWSLAENMVKKSN